MTKIGVLGGGQLARMLALAGYPLGIQILCYESLPDTCASDLTEVMVGDYADKRMLEKFARAVSCVTIETENLPIQCAEAIAAQCPMMPNVEALRITQDRLLEKNLLQSLGIPTAKYRNIGNVDELHGALSDFNFPAILKTRRQGYDGKGQAFINNTDSANRAFEQLSQHELILEGFVSFEKEVSLISVRGRHGETKFYPLVTNEHKDGILRISRAPTFDDALQKQAEDYAHKLMQHFDYVGVMTIEFFVTTDGLIANEIAPRVHNSGHWTIEGAITSQFENHLRAITGLPLGATDPVGYSVMCNVIGTEPAAASVLSIPYAHFHTYGKEPRPLRKLGHITLNHEDQTQAEYAATQILKLL